MNDSTQTVGGELAPPQPPSEVSDGERVARGQARNRRRRTRLQVAAAQAMLVAAALLTWEYGVRFGWFDPFFVGSPSALVTLFTEKLTTLIIPGALVTLEETLLGFLIGNIVGITAGLLLWYSPWLQRVLNPFIVAFGAVPILALAPLMIVWFGTGFQSKVVLAALSCVLVALVQALRGALSVDPDLIQLMRSFGASRHRIFTKIVVPSATSAVVGALRINIGFALIGAVIGEFISSDEGLGHMVLVASANFDLPTVILGVQLLSFLAIVISMLVGLVETYLLRWSSAGRPDSTRA